MEETRNLHIHNLLILNVMLLERFGLNLSHLVEHRADGFIKRFGL